MMTAPYVISSKKLTENDHLLKSIISKILIPLNSFRTALANDMEIILDYRAAICERRYPAEEDKNVTSTPVVLSNTTLKLPEK